MEKLSADQQESIRIASTERLRITAARTASVSEEDLETVDRQALMQIVAQGMSKKSAEKAAEEATKHKSDQTRHLEIQLEMKRMEVQREMESKRMETEMESKRMEIEAKQLELQAERERREHELHMAQMGRPRAEEVELGTEESRAEQPRVRAGTLADRVKRYGSALRQVITPMTNDTSEIPQFFENLEAVFQSFGSPTRLAC